MSVGQALELSGPTSLGSSGLVPLNVVVRGSPSAPSVVVPADGDYVLRAAVLATSDQSGSLVLQVAEGDNQLLYAEAPMGARTGVGTPASVCPGVVLWRSDEPCPDPCFPPGNLCMITGFPSPYFTARIFGSTYEGYVFDGETLQIRIRTATTLGPTLDIPYRNQSVWVRAHLDTDIDQLSVWYQDEPEPAGWMLTWAHHTTFGYGVLGLYSFQHGSPTAISGGSGVAEISDQPGPYQSPQSSWAVDYYTGAVVAAGAGAPGYSIHQSGWDRSHHLVWGWASFCENCPGTDAIITEDSRGYSGLNMPCGIGAAHLEGYVSFFADWFQSPRPVGDEGPVPIPYEVRLCHYTGQIPPDFPTYEVLATGVFSDHDHGAAQPWSADITLPAGSTFQITAQILESTIYTFDQPHIAAGGLHYYGGHIGMGLHLSVSANYSWDEGSLSTVSCGSSADLPSVIDLPTKGRVQAIKRLALLAGQVLSLFAYNPYAYTSAGLEVQALGTGLSIDPRPEDEG